MSARLLLTVAVMAAIIMSVSMAGAQIPAKMNYQVMLTDDSDQPLADQSVQLVFRLYQTPSGGGSIWTESHNATTNSIGVVSVTLGDSSPLPDSFDGPLWLQVEVGGQILSPRRELLSAPYALAAHGASGDGHSLDAADGDPTDVVYVNDSGKVEIGEDVFTVGSPKLRLVGEHNQTGAHIEADSNVTLTASVFALADSTGALVGNTGTTGGQYYPSTPTAVTGVTQGGYTAGLFVALGDGHGVRAESNGTGTALRAVAGGTGLAGYFNGGQGVEMRLEDSDTQFPVLYLVNNETSWYGDCLHLVSQAGADDYSNTLQSHCRNGRAGYFDKDTDDNKYAVHVISPSTTSEGLYVYGYFYSTSLMAREVETSRGKEAVFSVSSPEVEMVASGKASLAGGAARVEFERKFAESITGPGSLRVTATPVGAWSALYVESIDANGFNVRSDAGSPDVEFHWVAVGRSQGCERAPEVTIPDPEADRRAMQIKEEDLRARRSRDVEPASPSVVAAE